MLLAMSALPEGAGGSAAGCWCWDQATSSAAPASDSPVVLFRPLPLGGVGGSHELCTRPSCWPAGLPCREATAGPQRRALPGVTAQCLPLRRIDRYPAATASRRWGYLPLLVLAAPLLAPSSLSCVAPFPSPHPPESPVSSSLSGSASIPGCCAVCFCKPTGCSSAGAIGPLLTPLFSRCGTPPAAPQAGGGRWGVRPGGAPRAPPGVARTATAFVAAAISVLLLQVVSLRLILRCRPSLVG